MSTSTLLKESTCNFNATNTNHSTLTANVNSSADGGFKEFLPYSYLAKSAKSKTHYTKRRDFDEDYDEDDEDDDEMDDEYDNDADNENDMNEFIYVLNNEDIDNDPIDLLNHETFSDMQSINTEDMSFNAMSLSPPLPSSNSYQSKLKVITNTGVLQSPPTQSAATTQSLLGENTTSHKSGTAAAASLLVNNQLGYNHGELKSTLVEQASSSQNFYQQFPLLMPVQSLSNQNYYQVPNVPNSSLNSSLAFSGVQRPPGEA